MFCYTTKLWNNCKSITFIAAKDSVCYWRTVFAATFYNDFNSDLLLQSAVPTKPLLLFKLAVIPTSKLATYYCLAHFCSCKKSKVIDDKLFLKRFPSSLPLLAFYVEQH